MTRNKKHRADNARLFADTEMERVHFKSTHDYSFLSQTSRRIISKLNSIEVENETDCTRFGFYCWRNKSYEEQCFISVVRRKKTFT